jgi:hypothetical protein
MIDEKPKCKCHNVQMFWKKDLRNRKNGGHWSCRIKKLEIDRISGKKYRQTEKGKKSNQVRGKRYRETEKGQKTMRNHYKINKERINARHMATYEEHMKDPIWRMKISTKQRIKRNETNLGEKFINGDWI